jgi:hypothetical protein
LRELAHGLGSPDHALGERAQGLYKRSAVLYEPAAVIYRLPQDERALAEALCKEAPARCELAEVACEDTHDRIFAVEVLGKTPLLQKNEQGRLLGKES